MDYINRGYTIDRLEEEIEELRMEVGPCPCPCSHHVPCSAAAPCSHRANPHAHMHHSLPFFSCTQLERKEHKIRYKCNFIMNLEETIAFCQTKISNLESQQAELLQANNVQVGIIKRLKADPNSTRLVHPNRMCVCTNRCLVAPSHAHHTCPHTLTFSPLPPPCRHMVLAEIESVMSELMEAHQVYSTLMIANVTAAAAHAASVAAATNGVLMCPVCMETGKPDYASGSCRHVLCWDCVQKLPTYHDNHHPDTRTIVSCPVCRASNSTFCKMIIG